MAGRARIAAILCGAGLVAGACRDVPDGELRFVRGRQLVVAIGADGRGRDPQGHVAVFLDDAAGTLTGDDPRRHEHVRFVFRGDLQLVDETVGAPVTIAVRQGDHYRYVGPFAGFTVQPDGQVVMDDGTAWGRLVGYGPTVGLHRRAFALIALGVLPSIDGPPMTGRPAGP